LRYLFGDYTLDADRRELCRAGQPVHVEPQVFDLLLYVIRNRDRVVTKDDLIAGVWGGRIVAESTLGNRINAVRHAIGDSGERQQFIRTVARRGIMFVGDVREEEHGAASFGAADTTASAPPSPAVHAETLTAARDRAALPLPDKPSIAVLPFANLSDDPQQEYFCDGIAQDIITTLSKLHWLFVIARNSSFTYKGKTVDMRQVGRELGVRYVLEGSVRKAGNRVRITAQLVDATDGHHVWAERFDRALEDIFVVQDEITHSILGAMAPGILAAEIQRAQRKEIAELDQWERMMRAHWHVRRFTRDDCNEAIRLIEEGLQRDPSNAMALADLAYTWHMGGSFGWTKEPFPVAMDRMGDAARRAVASDDQDAAAQAALGLYELFSGRNEDAIRRLQRAVQLDPNSSFARGNLGVAHAFSAQCDAAIETLQDAIRLSPRDFLMVIWHTASAWSYLSAHRYEEAGDSAQRAIDSNPAFPDAHGTLAVANAHLGRMADARAALAGYVRLLPGLHITDERLMRPFKRPGDRDRFLDGLRMAGLREK
jgi:adenylate cyclase